MVKTMITGRQTLASIEQALTDVRIEEHRLKTELEKATQSKAALIEKRLLAFHDLAQFRTKLALVDGVIDEADQLSTQVKTILQARLKTIDALQRREQAAEDERAGLLLAQKQRAAQIEALEKRLDAIAGEARKALSKDSAYTTLRDHVKNLDDIAARAAAKAEKAAKEEQEKGAPYRNDPLFIYLWQRRYGTSDYEAGRIVRMLDGMVASLIQYADARANFAMLTEIPKRLSEHAARLAAERDAQRTRLEAIESEKIRDMAGVDFPAALAEARTLQDRETAQLEQLNGELAETGNQLRIYAEGHDQSFRKAIEQTVAFIEGESLRRLLDDARRTADPGDERIVELITNLAGDIEAIEKQMGSQKEALDRLFARKQDLMRIAADFRRARYDDPGSVFEPGQNTEGMLEQLLKGIITGAEYWARTKSSQRWRGRPGDSYRRTSSLPPIGRPPSTWSGGDFNTGGGF